MAIIFMSDKTVGILPRIYSISQTLSSSDFEMYFADEKYISFVENKELRIKISSGIFEAFYVFTPLLWL